MHRCDYELGFPVHRCDDKLGISSCTIVMTSWRNWEDVSLTTFEPMITHTETQRKVKTFVQGR